MQPSKGLHNQVVKIVAPLCLEETTSWPANSVYVKGSNQSWAKLILKSIETSKLEVKALQCYILTSAASFKVLTETEVMLCPVWWS
jgi:hypothetical protein